jgi:light-regulated signal transduction histidine kinase (bacteriophytochrome)
LIDELLQLSRLGRTEIHKSDINLSLIIDEVRKELEPESRGRSVVWRLDALPKVPADQAMMRQVMENLIGNALKFTRHCAEEIIFHVQDNGAGFDMRYYNKMFQVFQRLHGEDEFEGTGIGLANVRRIVERHGGRVWAEGSVGAGATFYFSLPQLCTQNGGPNELVESHLVG